MLKKRFRLEIFRSTVDKKFYFRVISRNGQTVMPSQGYTRKSHLLDLLESLNSDGHFAGCSVTDLTAPAKKHAS